MERADVYPGTWDDDLPGLLYDLIKELKVSFGRLPNVAIA